MFPDVLPVCENPYHTFCHYKLAKLLMYLSDASRVHDTVIATLCHIYFVMCTLFIQRGRK